MLTKTMLATMFAYNAATNQRLLSLAANLSDEQLDAPTGYSSDTLRQTFTHILQVEYNWRTTCATRTPSFGTSSFSPTPSIAELRAFATTEGQRAQDLIDRLSESELTTSFSAQHGDKTYLLVPWQILIHLLYHSAQHRSEASTQLTAYGCSPGDTDFMEFVLAQ